MNEELAALNLAEDFSKVLSCEDAYRWKLEKAGSLEVWVSLSPSSHTEEVFQARLLWITYPDEPPSLRFRDVTTGRIDLPTAWPIVRGFRPISLDACVNWCIRSEEAHV